jgi:hypothetical protein
MGNSKSILVKPFIENAPHINTTNEITIIKNLTHSSVVSYTIMIDINEDEQVLKFDRIVDAVNEFTCLTNGGKIDIFIDGIIHYENVEDFTLVLVAMTRNIVTIKKYSEQPVIIVCKGYSFAYEERLLLTVNKIKTDTTKYYEGFANKIII